METKQRAFYVIVYSSYYFFGNDIFSHEKMKNNSSQLFDKEEIFNSSLIESISNIETIKNYQVTNLFEKKVAHNLSDLFQVMQSFFAFNLLQTNMKNLVISLFNLVLVKKSVGNFLNQQQLPITDIFYAVPIAFLSDCAQG